MIDLKKYLDAFASEAEELLQTMNSSLLALEKKPDDKDTINQLFRCAHSIKGMSATMGFNQTAELAHSMESLMDGFRSGTREPAPDIFSLLFECADLLERSVKSVSTGGAEAETSELASRMNAEAARTDAAAEPAEAARPEEAKKAPEKAETGEKKAMPKKEAGPGQHAFLVSVTLKEECQMKPLKLELVRTRLSGIGTVTGEEKKSEAVTEYLLTTGEGMKRAESEAESVSGVEKAEVKLCAGQAPDPKKKPAQAEPEQPAHVKVPVARLDSLVNLAGELIAAKIRIRQAAPENNAALLDAVAALDRISAEIQNETMLARMVPAEQVFGKFPRMVRDLAKGEGKEINFTVEGADIELDRSVLDRIGEPLVHLLRNAVDHGIETPDERAAAGKQRTGNIKLSASREKNSILVEVSDDGRGLDTGEIRRAALAKKIAGESEIEGMDDKDVPWLMFRAGFSTSKNVTEISGRGVGLNIVKTATESMGGTIDVESEKGKGCRFALHLPLSLAIMRALLVESGGDTYAIPASCVQYIHKARKDEIRTVRKRKALILEGAAVPIIGLRETFRTQENGSEEETILVIKKGREKAGIAVDRVIGEQELMIKPLEQPAEGFSGASILPDGRVVLVPDIYGLI